MPKLFFVPLHFNSKQFRLLAILLLSPLFFLGQSLTGLWVGALSNDSTTIRKDQSFEIALTEYKGKVYGYSRSEFIVDDVLYYIVKRVKGTIEGDVCEVTDDDIVAYNFPRKLDKNIKVTSTFRRDKGDSVWHLDGKWKTNATKKYYSVTGNVALKVEPDLTASKIFPHLEELKLADELAFYKERKEGQPIVKIAKPEKIKTEYSSKTEQLSTDVAAITNIPAAQQSSPSIIPVKQQPVIPTNEETSLSKETTTTANKNPEAITKKEAIAATDKTNKSNTPSTITEKKEIKSAPVAVVDKPVVLSQPEKTVIKADTKITTNETVANNNKLVTDKPIEEKKDIKAIPIATTNNKQDVAVLKPQQDIPLKQPELITTKTEARNNTVVKTNTPVTNKPEEKAILKPEAVVKNNTKQDPVTSKQQQTIATNTIAKNNTKEDAVANKQQQPIAIKQQTEPVNTIAKTTTNSVVTATDKKDVFVAPVIPEIKKPDADITLKAALIAGRKSEFSQVVNFKSDSLQISLYDNGEIDGDTVSVFMNGEVLLSKQGLKSSAIRKTIYLTPGENDEFTLVMFAESLGKYPPNTGLLVIHDGTDVYNLRFSSDFQKNAGIVFRKKK